MDKLTSFLDRCAHAVQSKVFPILIKALLKFVLWTNKVEVVGFERYYKTLKAHPSIIIFWHNRIVISPIFFGEYCDPSSNYTAYISRSRDGEWLAKVSETYKHASTIRVPKRNKHGSLRTFIKTLKKSILIITPDGPRGPKYKIKPGVILAATAAKAQIFPFSWSATKVWELKSWDKLKIPKPFGKIIMGFGEPFFLQTEEKTSLEGKTLKAEKCLHAFREELNQRLQSPSSEPTKMSAHRKGSA